ncbi:MAG: PorT family protein [Bacteroidetes bacterium]|nr:PorT family protein [Bacteroidota bacterium]
MKKIFIITAIALSSNFLFGQEAENELKNFRFGLKFSPSINWYKPDGKIISAAGPVFGYGGGLVTEFRLAKVVSIQTGVQVDVDGGRMKYNNGGPNNANANTVSYYYLGLDDEIVVYDPILANSPSHTHYQLNKRTYKVTYITIPLSIKMKTKEIGSLTYYGHIGMNNSFRWKASANDELQVINDATNTLGTNDNKSKIDITKDVSVYAVSLNFGVGSELNFSGTTSLTFGLSYNLGFTNVVKSDSNYLGRRANSADYGSNPNSFVESKMPQSIKSNAVLLNVGVLF